MKNGASNRIPLQLTKQTRLKKSCQKNAQISLQEDEWLPNSPELNPLDYAIWSILEEKACAKPHKDVESLKPALFKIWDKITVEMLEKIVDNFPKRLKACVEAKAGHFE